MFRTLPPLTRGIILALIVSAVLSLIVPTLTTSALPLYPQLALRGFQFWRLVTYPFFVLASLHGLLSAVFTLLWTGFLLAMFGGELETIVHTKRLTIALVGTIIIGGIVFSLLSPIGVLIGPGIMTMFVLAGFSYLWPKREISIFGLFWIKAWIVATAVFLLSVIPINGLQLDTSAGNLFGPCFGALAGIFYFHVVYRQYRFGRAFLNRTEDFFSHRTTHAPSPTGDSKAIEAHIDSILDKIASRGMQSLSKEERAFLLKHSK